MELTYFNPNSQKEPDFLLGFVARQRIFNFFVRQLNLTRDGVPASHHLIVAPRGFGKTSMLRRIAIAIRLDEGLKNRFIALRFREEQHNVISLDVFWRNCILSIAEAREDEDAPIAEIEALHDAWEQHSPRQNLLQNEQDGEPAWQILNEYCLSLKRRPVLLIDNLDTLLQGLSSQHQWGLRKRLQSADGPIMISAASRYPDSTYDSEAAFYQFFRVHTLARLEDQEVFACLRTIAQHRGEAGQRVLELLSIDQGRVAALNTLAGGNPRTLSVLYVVLESHASADLLSQLNSMLDTFTGWYQARTEELPIQTRAVFDALALNWDPMTASSLGSATGLDTPVVSSQLSRLEKNNYVERVSLSSSGKGRNGYQVSERFFNIWYLMRNGPRRAHTSVFFLTKFLKTCFSSSERQKLGINALNNTVGDLGYTLAIASSLEDSPLRRQLLDQAHSLSHKMNEESEYQSLIIELRNEGRSQQGIPQNRALEAVEKKLKEYDEIITNLSESNDPNELIRLSNALTNKGVRLSELGRSEEAIRVYEEIISKFNDTKDPILLQRIATALVNKGARLKNLGEYALAIEACDEVVSRFQNIENSSLQERVAIALLNKSIILNESGETKTAILIAEDLIRRFEKSEDSAITYRVMMALINKTAWIDKVGDKEQAVALCDDITFRYKDSEDKNLIQQVIVAISNKAIMLGELNRLHDALKAYREAIDFIEKESSDPIVLERLARSWYGKGVTHGLLEQWQEAIDSYEQVFINFHQSSNPKIIQLVAMSQVNKGAALNQIGKKDESIKAFDQVIDAFSSSSDIDLLTQVSMALVNKGMRLVDLAQYESALKVYEEVITRFGSETDPDMSRRVTRALINKAVILGELGFPEKLILICDEVLSRIDYDEESMAANISMALLNRGIALQELERYDEAFSTYHEIIRRFESEEQTELTHWVGTAFEKIALLQIKLEKISESLKTYENAIKWNKNWIGFYIHLGNLLLDLKGNAEASLQVFSTGLELATLPSDISILNANISYLYGLYKFDHISSFKYAEKALQDGVNISSSGRRLLEALIAAGESPTSRWNSMFEKIGMAVAEEDSSLWSNHSDDLRRLLCFITAEGMGEIFRQWMVDAKYPQKYAPLYHAYIATLEGEDHLLQINPETRKPAAEIYYGLSKHLNTYKNQKKVNFNFTG